MNFFITLTRSCLHRFRFSDSALTCCALAMASSADTTQVLIAMTKGGVYVIDLSRRLDHTQSTYRIA